MKYVFFGFRMNVESKKIKGKYYQSLPIAGKETVDKFAAYIDLFFKNQEEAANTLMVGQGTISRYINGKSRIPQEVASLLVEHLKGKISLNEIYFNHKQYKLQQKMKTS